MVTKRFVYISCSQAQLQFFSKNLYFNICYENKTKKAVNNYKLVNENGAARG